MLLATQLQVILYHLLGGWLYGFGFSFLQVLLQYRQHTFLQFCCEICYHVAVTILLFIGLLQLNGAITNFYLFLFFLLGTYVYYRFYYILFFHWFTSLRRFIHMQIRKIAIAKSRMLGIIKKNTTVWKKGRRRHGRKKKSCTKNTS